MQNDFKTEILKCLCDDTLSIFCGAGATADVDTMADVNATADVDKNKNDWIELFDDKTQEFYEKEFTKDIYLLADLEKNYYNKTNFFKQLKKKINEKSNKKSTHIDNILKLNLNNIWTTNFDEIIEESIKRIHKFTPTIIKDSTDILVKNLNSKYVVYKMNGTIRDQKSMVLTKSDFVKYFNKQRILFELLKRQLVINSFLFIGYSFKDELVLNALREIKQVYPNQNRKHYRFVKNSEDPENKKYLEYEAKYFEDKYNIKSIFINNFCEIDTYLGDLYKEYCKKNVIITGSYRSIDEKTRSFLEKVVDTLVQDLFKNQYNIYSGNGRGIGEIVTACTSKHQKKFPKRKTILRPLIFSGDSCQTKRNKNIEILKDCKTNIIICGQDKSLFSSKNVIAQASAFIENNGLIIPIPATQFAAKEIFESKVFKKTTYYKKFSCEFQKLQNQTDPKNISKIVLEIISCVHSSI